MGLLLIGILIDLRDGLLELLEHVVLLLVGLLGLLLLDDLGVLVEGDLAVKLGTGGPVVAAAHGTGCRRVLENIVL